jgi:HEAT repeat protein
MLARHASEFNISRLAGLLADKNERVRSTAAAMLGQSKNRSPAVLAALVKALDLPGDAARAKICAALSALTGRPALYDPKADAAAREKALADWREWLAGRPKP